MHSCFHITGACIQKHYYPSLRSCVIQNNNLKIAWQNKLHTTVLTQFLCSLTGLVPMTSTFFSLTYFPHHPQPLLVVGPATSNKDGDLVLLQRTLVVFDGPHNALREETGRSATWITDGGFFKNICNICKSGSETEESKMQNLFYMCFKRTKGHLVTLCVFRSASKECPYMWVSIICIFTHSIVVFYNALLIKKLLFRSYGAELTKGTCIMYVNKYQSWLQWAAECSL